MSRTEKPQLFSAGMMTFIQVPSDQARSLHAYLCSHCVTCDQPGPSSTGVDVITLGKHADVPGIQALLDRWA